MPSIIPSPGSPGSDPNVTAPIAIDHDYVIAPGAIYFASGLTEPMVSTYGLQVPYYALLNQGTLWQRGEWAATLYSMNFGPIDNRGLIVAEATAGQAQAVFVSSTFQGGLNNSGRIFAIATQAAVAVEHWSGTQAPIVNSGLIAAKAGGGATAISGFNGGRVVNEASGSILAEGASAVAISFGRGHIPAPGRPNLPDIDNRGLIEAVASDPSRASVAIYAGSGEFEQMTIVNSGTIRADIAIIGGDAGMKPAQHSIQTVTNETGGLIEGAIFLDLGDDSIVNRGTIAGYVDLGEDDDLFDTSAGSFFGIAALGWGNDRFIGGAQAEAAVGDRGDDRIEGGGGDDLLLGGRGDDRLEGGAGNDGLFGEYGDDVIVTSGGDIVLAGAGDDIVQLGDYGFARVDGGSGTDILVLPDTGRLLDLEAALAGDRLTGFEAIRLPGAQELVLRHDDISRLTGGHVLAILAGAGGKVDLVGEDWLAGAVQTRDGVEYRAYSSGADQVLIQSGANVSILHEAPAGAIGLDAVAPGVGAPLPGDWPGSDLTGSETYVADYYALTSSLVIEGDEIWTAADGLAPLAGSDPFLQVENYGIVEAVGSSGATAARLTIGGFTNHGSLRASGGGTDADLSQNRSMLATYGVDIIVDKTNNAVDGLFVGANLANFVNRGTITATSTVGPAAGYSTYGDPGINEGLISAVSTRFIAYGVYAHNGAHAGDGFVNTGTISAEGELGAYGFRAQSHETRLDNRGTITALAHGAGVESVAVSFYYAMFTQTVINSGTIRGDIAIQTSWTVNGNALLLDNSGTIQGRIELNINPNGGPAPSDAIFNHGTIDGEVRLGGNHDLYDGTGGHQQGAVLGEAGADILIGTASGDVLSGGSDGDFIAGAGGADMLTGGAGRDVFAYASIADSTPGAPDRITDFQSGTDRIDLSALGVTSLSLAPRGGGVTLLTAQTADGALVIEVAGSIAAGDVTLANLTTLDGTTGVDLLAATAGGSRLSGGDGDDTLVGGAGADRLDGGADVDLMRGGLGDDVYVIDRPEDIVWESAGGGTDTVEMQTGGYPFGGWVLPDFVENLVLIGDGSNSNLAGNNLDNYLRGNDTGNFIDGGAGADRMEGRGGNDTYDVDDIGDQVIEAAGGGRDLVKSSISFVLADNVEDLQLTDAGLNGTGNALDNNISVMIFNLGLGGYRPSGNSILYGLGGNDQLLGYLDDDLLDGGDGDDRLNGNDGDDHLLGGAGSDRLDGGANGDRLEGGDGNDTIYADSGPILYDWGGSYQPVSAEDNVGTDWLVGGAGADDLYCGAGLDILVYAASGDSTEAALDRIHAFASGTDKIDLSALGALSLNWTVQGDLATASGYTLVTATGAGGILTLRIDGAVARSDFLYQDAGQTLSGSAGDNNLTGWNGNDSFFLEQGGADQAAGREGNDGFYFGAALGPGDKVDGGSGSDTLVIQGDYPWLSLAQIADVEVLLVASGRDTRFGDTAGNSYEYRVATLDATIAPGGTLTVNANDLRPDESLSFDGSAESDGKFRIFAGQGADDLKGGAGNDGFFFGADANLDGADRVVGGAGTDSVAVRGNYAGANAVVLQDASFTGIEVLTFLSGHSNEFGGPIAANGYDYDLSLADGNVAAGQRLDVIASNLRADESLRFDGRAESDGSLRILSGAGDDTLFGGSGNDTIHGGLGADSLDGGSGADTYLYCSTAESTAASRDTIVFGPGDRIDLSLIDANTGTGANDAFAFIGANAFSQTAGELRAFQSGSVWTVEGDVNGDGVADFVLAVTGAAPLVASDFVL